MNSDNESEGGGDTSKPSQEKKPAAEPPKKPSESKPQGPDNTEFHTFYIDRSNSEIDKGDG